MLGVSSLLNFFVQRYFSKKDEATRQHIKQQNDELAKSAKAREYREHTRDVEFQLLKDQVQLGLQTIKLLSYARVAEEADKLIEKGYATPAERLYLKNLHENYKDWQWNGDMDDRIRDVFNLPPKPPEHEATSCAKGCGNQCLKSLMKDEQQ